MRKPVPAMLCALCLLSVLPCAVQGQEWGWSGTLETVLGLDAGESFAPEDYEFAEERFTVDLRVEAKPSEAVRFAAEGRVRGDGMFSALTLADLSLAQKLAALEFGLLEASVDVYDVFLKGLDLRVGRQRIPWGPADKVGAVDVLNPLDLSDPLDFGRRLPSDAVRIRFSAEGFSLEADYIPLFAPALLPSDVSQLYSAALPDIPAPLSISVLPPSLILPAADPASHATLAVRAVVNLFGWDLAASYVYGRSGLPVATRITAAYAYPVTVNVATTLEFPREHIGGLDVSGELFGFGAWAEAAMVWPDHSVVTDLSAVPDGLGNPGAVTTEAAEAYAKWVVGLDYTLPFGPYASFQYVHGLFYEAGAENLEDYLFAGLEWTLPGDVVKIGPLGFVLEVRKPAEILSGTRAFEDSWAFAFNPEIALHPHDNAELACGLRWIDGKDGTTLAKAKEMDRIYVRGRFRF